MRLAEQSQIVVGFLPVDLSGGANDGDWVSLKNYGRCAVVFIGGTGTAGDDPILTIEQAQDVAGTGAKALNFTTIWSKQGADITAVGTFSKVTQSSANTYTNATAAEQQLVWIVEFDAADLDVDNGFDCLRGRVADVGTNAQLGSLHYVLSEPRYPQATVDSAIVD